MKINLCMIVKDEAHIIRRCLDSVEPLIDEVIIIDTGSTDNTKKVIKDYLKEKKLPGKIVDHPWQGFAYNRTRALKEARTTDCDYSLMIDADEILKFNIGFNPKIFKESLTYDIYNIPTKMSVSFYYRPTLTSNKKIFTYRGVVHELLNKDGASQTNIDADTQFYNYPIQDSTRNKNPHKFQEDAKLLEDALRTEKDDFLRSRYTFYAARAHKNALNFSKALDYFFQRTKMKFSSEEVYLSFLQAAKLQEQLEYPEDSIINTYLKAQEINPDRVEALYYLTKYCRTHNRNQLGYILGKEGLTKKFHDNFLFGEMWIYEYGMLDEFSVVAYWAGHYIESLQACQQLLTITSFPESYLSRVQANLQFAQNKLK